MTDSAADGFSDWNPHFTPRWLSEKLASHLPRSGVEAVVDPACGAGNLLVAAAHRLRVGDRDASSVELVGTDVSIRAVRACRRTLASVLPGARFRIEQADFLKEALELRRSGAVAVVMNPPFEGYGKMRPEVRRRVSRLYGMGGRFNLGYAFVRHALEVYRPERLVALLPSNWIYSGASRFRKELEPMSGAWEWEDIGDRAFVGIQAHLGILTWQRRSDKNSSSRRKIVRSAGTPPSFEVRYGVATGADSTFIEIAGDPPPFGRMVKAARGREVGREPKPQIWLPSRNTSSRDFRAHVGRAKSKALAGRSCVVGGRRAVFEYQEPIPDWLIRGPKLLIPEIVTNELRIELDREGSILPLHSVIVVKVSSKRSGASLRRFLLESSEQRRLLKTAPRLSGGAARVQLKALRHSIARWLRLAARKRLSAGPS